VRCGPHRENPPQSPSFAKREATGILELIEKLFDFFISI
jgi:hypothetical protein